MLKSTLRFLVTIKLLFTFQINAQPGIKLRMNTSALQSSTEDVRPFLVYEVLWLQYGTSNPEFGLQHGIFYTLKFSTYLTRQPQFYIKFQNYVLLLLKSMMFWEMKLRL